MQRGHQERHNGNGPSDACAARWPPEAAAVLQVALIVVVQGAQCGANDRLGSVWLLDIFIWFKLSVLMISVVKYFVKNVPHTYIGLNDSANNSAGDNATMQSIALELCSDLLKLWFSTRVG